MHGSFIQIHFVIKQHSGENQVSYHHEQMDKHYICHHFIVRVWTLYIHCICISTTEPSLQYSHHETVLQHHTVRRVYYDKLRWTIQSGVLTLSLALGRIAALAAGRFLQVISFGPATAAQGVRLVATLSKRRRTLRLGTKNISLGKDSWG